MFDQFAAVHDKFNIHLTLSVQTWEVLQRIWHAKAKVSDLLKARLSCRTKTWSDLDSCQLCFLRQELLLDALRAANISMELNGSINEELSLDESKFVEQSINFHGVAAKTFSFEGFDWGLHVVIHHFWVV